MVRDPGNTLKAAQRINVTANTDKIRNAVGLSDKLDFFHFTLGQRSSFNLSLSGLRKNADVVILDSRGALLQQSRRPGKKAEAISAALDAGTYYIKVSQRQGNTTYALQYSAIAQTSSGSNTPPPGNHVPGDNTAPTLNINGQLNLGRGNTVAITGNVLKVSDREQGAAELIFTLNQIPASGKLTLDGNALNIGSTFTQTDIDNGRLSYASADKTTHLNTNNLPVSVVSVFGSNTAWLGSDGKGNDTEVFFYNGSTGEIKQLTDNTANETALKVSDTGVVWQGVTAQNVFDIFFYNGMGTPQNISATTMGIDFYPQFSGSTVVWQSGIVQTAEIYAYNTLTGQLQPLTNDNLMDENPIISGNSITWRNANGIQFYNGTGSPITIPDSKGAFFSYVSGSNIAWSAIVNDRYEAFVYNGATGQTKQVSTNTIDGYVRGISGDNVIWQASDGSDKEIYVYNITTGQTTQITNNTTNDDFSRISGNYIAWNGFDGGDSDVFVYNVITKQTLQITNNTVPDMINDLSSTSIVWQSEGSALFSSMNSIFDAGDRFSFTVSDGKGGNTSSTFNIAFS